MNVALMLAERAHGDPKAIAVREAERIWTYGQASSLTASFARRLKAHGLAPGDRVLLVVPTCAEFVFAYFGILATGAVAVTTNTQSTASELAFLLDDADAGLVIAWHTTSRAAQDAARVAGVDFWALSPEQFTEDPLALHLAPEIRDCVSDDPAVLLYTSGTTGKPKGAVLSHGNIIAAAESFRATLLLGPDDRSGTALPLFHVFGQVAVLAAVVRSGGSLSLLHPFSGAALLEMAAAHRLTVLSGVPTMWIEMLHAQTWVGRDDLVHLRQVRSGGASLPTSVLREFRDRFGAEILEGYGLSETAAAATSHVLGRPAQAGSVGPPLAGVEIAIVDATGVAVPEGTIGEVTIRGPVVMRGYWNRLDATAEVLRGGWLHTGDLGRLDADGNLWLVDRMKDLIIRGGYNVYPREIEEVLHAHPAIREAAVLGVPDDRLGEEIAAVMVLVNDVTLELDTLRHWLSERLAGYKVPRLYHVVDELPKGSTGKIIKRAIDRQALSTVALRVLRS